MIRKIFRIFGVAVTLTVAGIFTLRGQAYTGHAYAGNQVDSVVNMPGPFISAGQGSGFDTPGIVNGQYFDIASDTGANFMADSGTVFGIHPPLPGQIPGDGGGIDVHSYSTKEFPNPEYYTPLRFNFGGPTLWWRQTGKWVRYTLRFEAGDYNFVYRGNTGNDGNRIQVKIFPSGDMGSSMQTISADLTGGVPGEGETKDNIFRIGGGTDRSDWMRILDTVTIETAGLYVVEIDEPDPYAGANWGAFTFNEMPEVIETEPFGGVAWSAPGDTISTWKYDIVAGDYSFSRDSGTVVGITGPVPAAGGVNIRNYPDDPAYTALRWDSTMQNFQSTGAWYRYTCSFNETGELYFAFRGHDLSDEPQWNCQVRVVVPITGEVIAETGFATGVEKLDPADTSGTSWYYMTNPLQVKEKREYVVELSFPVVGLPGFMESFSFMDQNPADLVPRMIQYDWPRTASESEFYDVVVYQDGKAYDMFTHISKPVLEDGPDGDGVTGIFEDRSISFVSFSFSGEITVKAFKKYGSGKAPRVRISPKAFGINPHYFDGDTVVFNLRHNHKGPSYISVEFDIPENKDDGNNGVTSIKNGLMILGDRPETYLPDTTVNGFVRYSPDLDQNTIRNASLLCFGPGEHRLKDTFENGVIRLTKNNQKIYVAGGAIVHGAFHGEGMDNIWIYGRGLITGREFVWHEIRDEDGKKDAFLNFMGSSGCHFEGFMITNPTHHTIPSSQDTYLKNVKIIGWASNHDGIRPSGGSYAEGLFLKTSDDRDYARDVHTVRKCVAWPMRNGAWGQLGWNNLGVGYTTYEDIFFINGEWDVQISDKGNVGVIGSVLNQGVNLEKDTVRDIYMEDFTAILANLRISRDASKDLSPSDPGEIKNFYFGNVKVENAFRVNTGERIKQVIRGFEYNGIKATIHDITFVNLIAGNRLVTQENHSDYFNIDDNTAYNIFFRSEGEIHTLRAVSNEGGKLTPSGDIHVPDGTSQYVFVQPQAGYRIKDVRVDSVSLGRLQVVHLDEITGDHLVEVVFEEGEDYFDLEEVKDPNDFIRGDMDIADDIPPEIISCAPAQNLQADSTNQVVLPDLTGTVKAMDNRVGDLTVEQSPQAGTLVGIGETEVLLTVTDVAGNVSKCTATVTVEEWTPDGLDSRTGGPEVSLFPNPSRQKVTLSFASVEPAVIRVLNLEGRVVLFSHKKPGTAEYELDGGQMEPGTYFIRITQDRAVCMLKWIRLSNGG